MRVSVRGSLIHYFDPHSHMPDVRSISIGTTIRYIWRSVVDAQHSQYRMGLGDLTTDSFNQDFFRVKNNYIPIQTNCLVLVYIEISLKLNRPILFKHVFTTFLKTLLFFIQAR